MTVSLFPHQHLVLSLFFILPILIGIVVSHYSSSLRSSNGEWYWAHFHVLICQLYTLFSEISLHIFCPFSNWTVWGFLLLNVESSLHILDKNPLQICYLKIFPPAYHLSFHLLNRIFHTQIFKTIFDEVQFTSFSLHSPTFHSTNTYYMSKIYQYSRYP